MTTSHFDICTIFWLMLINAKCIMTDCKFHSIQLPIDGHACRTQEYINISATESHHCSLACIHNKECSATVHDLNHSTCMLLPQPCVLLEPREDHVYQAFQYPCTKWVPKDDDTPGYYVIAGNVMINIVRKFINDGVVVGRMVSKFYAIHPSGTSVITGSYDERLIVDASCQVTWVMYDSTTGQTLPDGALIGGFLVATNIYLYT